MNNEKKCTNIELWRLIEKFNHNNALKISISENDLGYKILTVGNEQQQPMTTIEALYFVMGMKYIKEMPC